MIKITNFTETNRNNRRFGDILPVAWEYQVRYMFYYTKTYTMVDYFTY